MFIQVIEGRVADAEGLRRQIERWQQELKPGAEGYIGSTGGVADDGTSVVVVRFDSEEAARRNSDRTEQGEWWAETAKYYEGDVTFNNSSDVEIVLSPGSDDAGFVQVMQGRCADRQRLQAVEEAMESTLREQRPDLIGDVRAWYGDNEFTMVGYFTSESDARQNESKPLPPAAQAGFDEWQSLMAGMRFVDLRHPWLDSA